MQTQAHNLYAPQTVATVKSNFAVQGIYSAACLALDYYRDANGQVIYQGLYRLSRWSNPTKQDCMDARRDFIAVLNGPNPLCTQDRFDMIKAVRALAAA
jgi:hypothetical protein